MKRAKIFALLTAIAVGIVPAVPVGAADAASEAALANAKAQVEDLQSEKEELTSQMDDVEAQLVTTVASINSVNENIANLESQIDTTQTDLDAATEKMNTQYAAMKKRIQFVYETGGNAGWGGVVLGSDNIDTLLTGVEYTQEMYSYDTDCQEEYKATVEEVQNLKTQLTDQKSEQEEQKNQLVQAQDYLNTLTDQLNAKYDDADARLQNAYAVAAKYQTIVDEQNRQIAIIAAQQRAAAAEAARRQAAAQAAAQQQAAQQAAAQQQAAAAAAAQQAASQSAAQQTASQSAAQQTASQEASQQAAAWQNAPSSTTAPSDASGNAVLDYARQYLGGSYVWGGTTLGSGVDCSGYVQQIYKNFGVNLPRTSYEQANAGTEVSYADIQTGDVVVYDGHVGIYAGNGQIINAANPARGICYTPVDYAPIQTIRRVQ